MKQAIVVGSGAGGATAARELQGAFQVTVLEAGRPFRPLKMRLDALEALRRPGLMFDERLIRLVFPAYRVRKASGGMVLLNGVGPGGTTTICTGNALRLDGGLRALGIDLDAEFAEIYREIPVTAAHQGRWRAASRQLRACFQDLGLDPQAMPKMGAYERCRHCGRCQLGCPYGVKWDSRRYLDEARKRGAALLTGWQVERVVLEEGRAAGVLARSGLRRRFFPADLVVLAAGGFGSPLILQRSGIATEARLSVDPVLCVAARVPGCNLHRDVTMPFYSVQDGTILSPYFDHVSFYFNRRWRVPAGDLAALQIKLADESQGSITRRGVDKRLTAADRRRLQAGVDACRAVLCRFGAREEDIFTGTLIAGHPGGMLPLAAQDAPSLHPARLPRNLYLADATLLPRALGGPPILTIIALAKRVSRACREAAA